MHELFLSIVRLFHISQVEDIPKKVKHNSKSRYYSNQDKKSEDIFVSSMGCECNNGCYAIIYWRPYRPVKVVFMGCWQRTSIFFVLWRVWKSWSGRNTNASQIEGFSVIKDPKEIAVFTVNQLIDRNFWLNSSEIPYENGIWLHYNTSI